MNRNQDRMIQLRRVSAAVALTALAACGGGGGGEGDGGGDPVTYTVGGLAAGVNGPGLELRNGDERLSVPLTGSFTFATRLAQGASYAVTVTGHPIGQTCSATNASGTVGGSNVTNIAVACVAAAPVPGVQLLAGTFGGHGHADGPPTEARFDSPSAVVVDAQGNRYVADTFNHVIRRIAPDGQVSTLAGAPRLSGATDGVGDAARFVHPRGLALDGAGALYVADSGSHTVRRIRLSDREVTTVAGVPFHAGADTGGAGQPATLNRPMALVFAGSILLIADAGNHAVRALVATQVVVPHAGVAGQAGDAVPEAERHLARFRSPTALAVRPGSGEVLVLDQDNCVLRTITATAVRTLAGENGDCRAVDGSRALGRLNSAQPTWESPTTGGLAVAASGRVLVADRSGLREMGADGSLRTIALTSGGQAWSHGRITGLAFDGDPARLLAVEPAGHAVVTLALAADSAQASVLAGQRPGSGTPVVAGSFGALRGVALAGDAGVDLHGSLGIHRISGSGSVEQRLALMPGQATVRSTASTPSGRLYAVIESFGLTGPRSWVNGYQDGQSLFSVPSAGAMDNPGAALIDDPVAVDVDSAGRAVVVDIMASVVRRVAPDGSVTRLAGQVGQYESRMGDALDEAAFAELTDVAVADNDDIYVLDGRSVIRIAQVNGRHVVTPLAQEIEGAAAIAVDEHGDVYVALTAPRCEVLRIRASGGEPEVVAGMSGRCTFVPGALPGALPLTGATVRMKARQGRIVLMLENAVFTIGPLAP